MAIERMPVSKQAYTEIRSRVMQGSFEPGARLIVRPLAEELGLSPTPVKSALAELAAEGLVTSVPDRGYFVQTFDEAAIKEIYDFRGATDRLAAELAAGQPDRKALVVELKRNLAQQGDAIDSGDTRLYADLNNEFHKLISEAAGNRWLSKAAASLAGQMRLLVNSSAKSPNRPMQSLAEHANILDAISAGDQASAGAHALEHALHGEWILLGMLGNNEQPREVSSDN